MIRLLIIKSAGKRSFFFRLFSPFFEAEIYDYIQKNEIRQIIGKVDPDFVFTDLNKPVNGIDLMSMVSELDDITRLRAFYINLFYFKWKIRFPVLNLKSRLFSLLFENRTAKKTY